MCKDKDSWIILNVIVNHSIKIALKFWCYFSVIYHLYFLFTLFMTVKYKSFQISFQ